MSDKLDKMMAKAMKAVDKEIEKEYKIPHVGSDKTFVFVKNGEEGNKLYYSREHNTPDDHYGAQASEKIEPVTARILNEQAEKYQGDYDANKSVTIITRKNSHLDKKEIDIFQNPYVNFERMIKGDVDIQKLQEVCHGIGGTFIRKHGTGNDCIKDKER